MKRYIVAIFVLFAFHVVVRSQSLSSAISFEERVHNFGTILEKNGKVSHTFTFKNNGKTPVTINDIHSSCGCVGKIISKDAVKPGAKGKVTITFNPDYKSGFFSKEIIVYSNGGQNFNRIWVEGTVKPSEHPIEDEYPYNFGKGLYLRLKVMALGYVAPGEIKQAQLHYANSTDKTMSLHFETEGKKDGLVFTNPGTLKAGERGVINFSYRLPANAKDDVVIKLFPHVNNKRLSETVEIKVLNESKRSQAALPKQNN